MMKMWNTHTMPIMLALVMAFIDHLVTIGAFFCHPRFVSKQQSHQKAARCRLSRIQQQQHSITKSTMYASSIQHGSAHDSHCGVSNTPNRRKFVTDWSATIMTTILVPQYAMAAELGRTSNKALRKTGIADGNLSELPPEAARSYLQYRIPLQISADYYLLDFKDLIESVEGWGDVNQLFATASSRGGQGQPNRIERDFVNPMRILGLSMPPEAADELRDAQFKFERAMGNINKAVAGIRRNLPVEIQQDDIKLAQQGWEDGRLALNTFFVLLNSATGLSNELRTIPPSGPDQIKSYGRSPRRYYELAKKTKLCQNRGGPALSQAWGGLMVSGYMQDSCGIPSMDEYFFQ